MRAMFCKELTGPDGLALGEAPPPAAGDGQVQIAVHACGLNFADTLITQGKYQVRPDLPFVPGMEVGGEIIACGKGVTGFRPGDRVLATTGVGGLAEEVVADSDRVWKIPDSMDFATAAAFPVAYGTSHGALRYRVNLQAGEVLLVHGASGGVGLTAVEVGKAVGATVIATASSDEKLQVARDHGADHGINYTTESIRDRVKALTGGADVVYDPVGGDAFMESLRCINWEGRILVIGFASGTIPQIPANYLLLKNCAAVGFFWGAYQDRDPAVIRRSMDEALVWYGEGKFKPHISHRLPLEKAADGFNLLAARKSTGKVVIETRK